MARRKSTKKEVIDTKEMEIIEISQPKQIVNEDNLNTEKDELLDVSEEVVNNDVIMGDSSATTMCAADLANVGIALSSNEESVAVEKRVSPEAVL